MNKLYYLSTLNFKFLKPHDLKIFLNFSVILKSWSENYIYKGTAREVAGIIASALKEILVTIVKKRLPQLPHA